MCTGCGVVTVGAENVRRTADGRTRRRRLGCGSVFTDRHPALTTLANPVLRRIARVLQLTQSVALVLVLAAGAVLLDNARNYGQANDWVDHTHEVLDQLNLVRTAMLRGSVALRSQALLPQPVSLERLRTAVGEARLAAQSLEALVRDNAEQLGRAVEVQSETAEITGWYMASATIAERDGEEALRQGVIERISVDNARRLRVLLDDMDRAERRLLRERQDLLERELLAMKRWAAGLGVAFVAFILWTLAYSTRLVRLNDKDMQQLSESADTDPLTGLSNRRALDRKVQSLKGRAMSVLVFDLDDFKPVNDIHGHAAGDEVLRTVGRRLREQCRDADILARVGGDEFVIVFPGLDNALRMGQIQARLNLALSEPMKVEGAQVRVGASIGYAVSRGEKTYEQLLQAADDMSYEEKKRRKAAKAGEATTSTTAGTSPSE